MEGSATFLAGAVTFFKDTLLPIATDMLAWATTTEPVKYYVYISLIGAFIGIYRVIKRG